MKPILILLALISFSPMLHADNSLIGTWLNVDSKSTGITRLLIKQTNDGLTVTTFGRCSPLDCVWGETALVPNGTQGFTFGYVNNGGILNFSTTQIDAKTINLTLNKSTSSDSSNSTVENITVTHVESGPNIYIKLH